MNVTNRLKQLLERWHQETSRSEEAWPEVRDLLSEEINQLVAITRVKQYSEDQKGYNNKPPALAFLAMIKTEEALQAILQSLDYRDLWTANWAVFAIAHLWPDPRFKERLMTLRKWASSSPILDHLICTRMGLALYRMGDPKGLEDLIAQALNFDSSFEAKNYHDRMGACHYLARFVHPEDLDKLVSILGRGAYKYIADRLVADKGKDLIPRLKEEFAQDPPYKFFIAFTLCRLGDREGFEFTKEVFLNYERYPNQDYPVLRSLDALTGRSFPPFEGQGHRYPQQELCPVLFDFIAKEISKKDGGSPRFIEAVLFALEACPSTRLKEVLQKLRLHIQSINWSKQNKESVIRALAKLEG